MGRRLATFCLAVCVLAFGYAGTVSLPSWSLVCRISGTEMAPSDCCHPEGVDTPEHPGLSNARCCDIKPIAERSETLVVSSTTLELPVVTLPTIVIAFPPLVAKTVGYAPRFSESPPRAPPRSSASPRAPPVV